MNRAGRGIEHLYYYIRQKNYLMKRERADVVTGIIKYQKIEEETSEHKQVLQGFQFLYEKMLEQDIKITEQCRMIQTMQATLWKMQQDYEKLKRESDERLNRSASIYS